jgi:TfoX/Sxy family transcriptional regulator of competence genes
LVVLLKWYIEEETKELREAFEKEILKWPAVDYKKMFGCPYYLTNGKMFAGLVTKGLVITKLNNLEKSELEKIKKTKAFKAGDKVIKSWVQINVEPNQLEKILPFVKKSYARAMKNAK